MNSTATTAATLTAALEAAQAQYETEVYTYGQPTAATRAAYCAAFDAFDADNRKQMLAAQRVVKLLNSITPNDRRLAAC